MSIPEDKDSLPRNYRCPFCGVRIFQNTRFCYHCGQPICEGDAVVVTSESQSSSFSEKESALMSFTLSSSSESSSKFDESTKDNPYVSPPLPSQGNYVLSSTINPTELSQKISRSWKCYFFFRNFAIAIIALLFLGLHLSSKTNLSREDNLYMILVYGCFFAIIFSLIALICGLVLFYQLWQVVPPGMAATTPGRAVGFLFIPLFNLYWMFIAYYQLAKHYRVLTKLAGRETGHDVLTCITMFSLLRLYKESLFVLENYQKLTEGNKSE